MQSVEPCPSLECLAYADNMACLADTFSELQSGVKEVMSEVMRLLKMQVAVDKSWSWSTHTQQRKELTSLQLDRTNHSYQTAGQCSRMRY